MVDTIYQIPFVSFHLLHPNPSGQRFRRLAAALPLSPDDLIDAESGRKLNEILRQMGSDEMLGAFEAAWEEVVAEQVAGNADFARAWESLSNFRAEYAKWKNLGYLD